MIGPASHTGDATHADLGANHRDAAMNGDATTATCDRGHPDARREDLTTSDEGLGYSRTHQAKKGGQIGGAPPKLGSGVGQNDLPNVGDNADIQGQYR